MNLMRKDEYPIRLPIQNMSNRLIWIIMNGGNGSRDILVSTLIFRQKNSFIFIGNKIDAGYGVYLGPMGMLSKIDETPESIGFSESEMAHLLVSGSCNELLLGCRPLHLGIMGVDVQMCEHSPD